MPDQHSGWIARRAQQALTSGLSRAYNTVKVDPVLFLQELRVAHGLPVSSFDDVRNLPEHVIDGLVDQTISASMKLAAVEGLGFGMGGILTLVPDLGVLSTIALRMVQKISLLYGFEYASDQEIAELWVGVAVAAGIDMGKELLEKQVVAKLVPRIIQRIAVKTGAEIAEKWAARIVPIISGAICGALNYYFIRQWGARAKRYYRDKHVALNAQPSSSRITILPPAAKN